MSIFRTRNFLRVFSCALLPLTSLLLLAGCDPAQRIDLHQAKSEVLRNDNANTEKILQGQINILKNDLGEQERLLANVVNANKKLTEQLEVQRQAIVDQQFDGKDLRKIVEVALGAGGQVAGGNITGAVKTVIDAAAEETKKSAQEKAKAYSDAVAAKLGEFQDDTETTLLSMSREAESLESKLAELPTELQGKLEKVRQVSQADKDALKSQIEQAKNPAEIDRAIAEYLATQGLTSAEIQKLQETFGTPELLGLLGLGGAYAYRKFGKSAYKGRETKAGVYWSRNEVEGDAPPKAQDTLVSPSHQTVNITVADDKMTVDRKDR